MSKDLIKSPVRAIATRPTDFPSEKMLHPSVFTPDFKQIPGNAARLLDMLTKSIDDFKNRYEFTQKIDEIPSETPYSLLRVEVFKIATKAGGDISNIYKNLLVKGVPTKLILSKIDLEPPKLATTGWKAHNDKITKLSDKVREWDGIEPPKQYLERMFKLEEEASSLIEGPVDARNEIYSKDTLLRVLTPFLDKKTFETKKKALDDAGNKLDDLGEPAEEVRNLIRNNLLIHGTIYDAAGTLKPRQTLEEEIDIYKFTKKPQGMFSEGCSEFCPTHFGVSFGGKDEEEIRRAIKKEFPDAHDIQIEQEFELNWDRYFSAWVDLVTWKSENKTTTQNKKENKSLDEFV